MVVESSNKDWFHRADVLRRSHPLFYKTVQFEIWPFSGFMRLSAYAP